MLRKHRLVNAGWMLTSIGLIALVATTAGLIVRGYLMGEWPWLA
ncbi:hypothetical protein [Sphaerisporangium dianthi]|uniref:Uncharacterized protein n=1 Tax=Sphaerisporangium dianthi TaxID=1436120 RepID=A0ABV9CVC1_9ACTN